MPETYPRPLRPREDLDDLAILNGWAPYHQRAAVGGLLADLYSEIFPEADLADLFDALACRKGFVAYVAAVDEVQAGRTLRARWARQKHGLL